LRGHRLYIVLAAAIVVAVVAAVLVVTLSRGSSTPSHVDDWFVGSWRVTTPMVGVSGDLLVARPGAPAGVIHVTRAKDGLMVSMTGFPGVSTGAVLGTMTPFSVHYQTADIGQGVGRWAMGVRTPTTAALAYYDPNTERWSQRTMLAKE